MKTKRFYVDMDGWKEYYEDVFKKKDYFDLLVIRRNRRRNRNDTTNK